jgi:hypothetical protein
MNKENGTVIMGGMEDGKALRRRRKLIMWRWAYLSLKRLPGTDQGNEGALGLYYHNHRR